MCVEGRRREEGGEKKKRKKDEEGRKDRSPHPLECMRVAIQGQLGDAGREQANTRTRTH